MNDETAEQLREWARDGVHVAVGSGLLAFQRLQVIRREIDDRLEEVQEALPEPGRSLLAAAREASKAQEAALRRLIFPSK